MADKPDLLAKSDKSDSKPDTAGIQTWLRNNPNDPRAGAVRDKLKSMGVETEAQGEQPGVMGYVGDRLGAFIQGTLLDPAEKVGQMAEHLPGALGRGARYVGANLPSALTSYLDEHRQMGERHPGYRLGGNLTGAFMLPGGGRTLAGDVAIGTGGGVLQPLDPNDPSYWRDVGLQGALGGSLSGAFGAATRGAGATARAAKNVYQHIYDTLEGRASTRAPQTITPNTATQVRNEVGGELGRIYQQMMFNPNTAGWLPSLIQMRDRVMNTLVDPAMRARWASVFTNQVFRPMFQPSATSTRAPWISGTLLHQMMSHLSGETNAFFREARKGGANAMMWNQMARGLQQAQRGVEAQLDAAFPALGAARRRANEAYQWADVMWRESHAGNRWVPPPTQLDRAAERKFGSTAYTAPGGRHTGVREMLGKEAQRMPRPGHRGVLYEAVRIPGMIAGYEVGRMMGHPLEGAIAGGMLGRAAVPAVRGAAQRAGRVPGVVGAGAGQAVRGEELLVTPKGARWVPDEESK